jgi:hypothetical protein
MPSWLGGLFSLLGTAAKLLASFLHDKEVRQGATAAQVAADEKETIRDVQTAAEARQGADRNLAQHPDQLRDDDGFKRPD